jgi:hypothetical protein
VSPGRGSYERHDGLPDIAGEDEWSPDKALLLEEVKVGCRHGKGRNPDRIDLVLVGCVRSRSRQRERFRSLVEFGLRVLSHPPEPERSMRGHASQPFTRLAHERVGGHRPPSARRIVKRAIGHPRDEGVRAAVE